MITTRIDWYVLPVFGLPEDQAKPIWLNSSETIKLVNHVIQGASCYKGSSCSSSFVPKVIRMHLMSSHDKNHRPPWPLHCVWSQSPCFYIRIGLLEVPRDLLPSAMRGQFMDMKVTNPELVWSPTLGIPRRGHNHHGQYGRTFFFDTQAWRGAV